MPTMTIRSDILSDRISGQDLLDIDAVEAAFEDLGNRFSLDDAAQDLLSNALSNDPTSIMATAVQWGTANDGLVLTGTGLSQINNVSQLQDDLENGIASGAFDTLTINSGGDVLVSVQFAPGQYKITAGDQTLTLAGALPDTMQDMFDFVLTLADLATNEDANGSATRADLISFFDAYGLSRLTHNDGTQDVFDISVGTSALSLEVGGAKAELTGTFPTASLGDLLSFLETYADADITDLASVPELAVSNFKLTDKNGNVQVEIDGNVGETDPLFLDTVTVTGTDERDSGIYLPYFTAQEAGVVNINLGAGYDSIEFDVSDYIYGDLPAPTNIDFGEDGGITVLNNRQSGRFDVDFGADTITATWEEYAGFDPNTNASIFDERAVTLNYVALSRVELGVTNPFNGEAIETAVIGTQDNERVIIGESNHSVFFAGGGGTDIVDMHRTNFETRQDSGLTYEDFVNAAAFGVNGDYISLDVFKDAGFGDFVGLNLLDVDQIQFRVGDDDREYRDVSEILNDLNVTAGGSTDDLLIGTAPGRTYAGLAGDDDIYAGGFLGRFAGDTAGQVYRLYQATLDRAPDAGGYNGWAKILSEGSQSLTDVAAGFVNSAEFRSVYENLTDADFVELLYQNVLNRAADAGGLQGWLDVMDGGLARAGVVTGFSESGEFRNNTTAEAAVYATGADPASWSDEVYRIYQATFARDPDAGGFFGWTDLLSSGTTLDEAIAGFTQGQEFLNTYGDVDDTQFVELLYQNVLDRAADAAGLQGWLDAMSGGLAREGVVQGFSESGEFRNNTQDGLREWMQNNTEDNVVSGGSGVNSLSGGIGSDTFVFDKNEDADSTVLDLEAWDYISIQGVDNMAQVDAALSQVGSDVVFELDDLKITFLNTQRDDMADDMFLL